MNKLGLKLGLYPALFGINAIAIVTGDPTSALVRDNTAISTGDTWLAGSGCILDITFNGNLGTVSTPNASKIVVNTLYTGYVNGVLTALTRSIVAVKGLRYVLPNDGTYVARVPTTDTVVSYILKSRVFSDETITSIVVTSGAYNTSNTKTIFPVNITNSSTLAPDKGVAKFVTPYDLPAVSGSTTFRVEVAGGHWAARNNQQFDSIFFTATDQHSNTVTALVTAPTLSTSITGGNASGVYAETWPWDVPLSTLTQGDRVTVNFEANPWIGNAASRLKSDIAGNGGDGFAYQTAGCTQLSPLQFLNDKTGAYGLPYVYVNSVTGIAGGTVSTIAATARLIPFDTIQHALAAAQTFCNSGGSFTARNNVGQVHCRLMDAGAITSFGATMAAVNAGLTWCVIEDDPLNVGRVTFTSAVGSASNTTTKLACDLLMFTGRIDFTPPDTVNGSQTMVYSGSTAGNNKRIFWGDGINFTGFTGINTPVINGFQWQFGRNFTCASVGNPFFASFSTNVVNWMLQAGIVQTGTGGSMRLANTVGCIFTDHKATAQVTTGQTTECSDGFILMNTRFTKLGTAFKVGETAGLTRGACLSTLLIELCDASGTNACAALSFDGTTFSIANMIVSNCTFIGGRTNWYYNDDDTTVGKLATGSNAHCVIEQENMKSDTFTRGSAPIASVATSKNRTGNWRSRNRIDCGPHLQFGPDFGGNIPPTAVANEINDPGTVYLQTASATEATMITQRAAMFNAQNCGIAGTGGGDYTWKTGLANSIKTLVAVGAAQNRYALDGTARKTGGGYPGCYEGP